MRRTPGIMWYISDLILCTGYCSAEPFGAVLQFSVYIIHTTQCRMLFIWSSVPYRTNKVDAGHTVSAARSNITVNDLNEKRVRLFLKEHSFKSDLECYHTQGTGYVSSQVSSIFCSMLLNKSFSIQSGCPLIGWGTWLRKDQPDSWRKQTEGSCPTFVSVFGLNTL